MIKQVGLLPAGCQPWNNNVCASSGDRFAYCATLAIYVYQLDKKYNQFKLLSILSEHKKSISAIAWNPKDSDIVASAAYDQKIIVWNVQKERPVAIFDLQKGAPTCIDWCLLHGESVSYICGRGPVFLWNYMSNDLSKSSVKESTGFSSDITCFRWHPKKTEKLAYGHKDGTVSFGTLGSKTIRHVLKPVYDDDDDDDIKDPVVAVEWDPLSVDYILICNLQSGIRLVDSTSQTCITSFYLPSSATQVKTLSWINGAPGMFITGDALSGILRVWNVSKSSPVENIRVKRTGFHALQVICDNNNQQKQSKYCDSNVNSGQSSTSITVAPTKITSSHFAMPPARVVCTFLDGGVGLYDLGRQKWEFIREQGHIETIFDCEFCPFDSKLLATGSFDGTVKVWDVTTFSCHGNHPVYTVVWNQKDSRRIMSSAADGYWSIRVWDYSQDACICTLNGHQGPVRGLIWNMEIPYLIISGSWDSSIRMWDFRDGKCLHVLLDHGADVYGLACHPSRPFILASCSRDSTVRLWSLASLVQPIEINILAGKPWNQILGTNENVMDPKKGPLLSGRVSRELKLEAEEFPSDARNRAIKIFSKFFMTPAGTENLWELVSILQGYDDTFLSENYKKGIMHVKHLIKYHCSDAQELEMAKLTKHGGGIGSPSKEERLREAAQLHLKTGNIQRYCEMMVSLGEWERALAVAPGVSHLYWKQLADRYTHYLIQEDKDDTAVFCTAIGSTEMLIDFYTSRGQMSDAVLSAQVACEGLASNSSNIHKYSTSNICNGVEQSETNQQLLRKTVEDWSDWYSSNCSPIQAACCYLAIDNPQKAICKLIQGNELELAVSMGLVLGNLQSYTSLAIEMLSRRCERLGLWDLAVDLLHQIPDNKILLAKCCARCGMNTEDINTLHQRAHLPSLSECSIEAEKLKRRNNQYECIMYYLLSTTPETGLELGLQYVKDIMKSTEWTADNIFDIMQLLGCIRTDVLLTHRKKGELLALCSYIGALEAIKRGYYGIVIPLFNQVRRLLKNESYIDIGITESDIELQSLAWCNNHSTQQYSSTQYTKPVYNAETSEKNETIYKNLMSRVGTESTQLIFGEDTVSYTHLPSHSDIHLSCLTGERIQGLAYFLEDGASAVSPNEALMWGKVNPFSPVASGYRMNPF
ncbi:Anaphase-promoting complex subunit 4 WD40 domain [Mactra antiquata]